MNKSWMTLDNRYSKEYQKGVDNFFKFAKVHVGSNVDMRCPCIECGNKHKHSTLVIKYHLVRHGISPTYTTWKHHGETSIIDRHVASTGGVPANESDTPIHDRVVDHDELPNMLEDVYMSTFANEDLGELPTASENSDIGSIFELLGDAQRPLYPECKKFSVLSFAVKMLDIKVTYKWSDRCFDTLMQLLKELLPKCDEKVPWTLYETKKFLRDLGLGYEPIHACKYDCALFWKENAHLDKCPVCEEPRYELDKKEGKKIPRKLLRYFPLTPRLKRLYGSKLTATCMRWHKEKRDDDGVLKHPADGQEWKRFEQQHPDFSKEARNVMLGLSTDGFNPFGNMSTSYSVWPVIVTPYNLPPWMCMKEPFCMMTLLIPGPLAPGRDIDVYMRPLVDELKELWHIGVSTYDSSVGESFQMRVAVLWTINDLPAYGNVSGWGTKGYLACPTCNGNPCSQRLTDKIGYAGARRYLPENHQWRRSKLFNGQPDHSSKPIELNGEEIFEQVNSGTYKPFGKHPKHKKRKVSENPVLNWKKKSILWELPYWKTLNLRHNLDVMHIEKNICDNLLGTILRLNGKNKDTDKARLDLEKLKIRKDLHLISNENGSFSKPVAPYALSTKERQEFFEFLKSIKYPDGYAANLSRCITADGNKITGLKTHDCHVLLQRLLPIGMRGFLDKDICTTLFELGNFFQQLCSKTLKVSDLEKLEERIVLILCKLEKIFPPAFFDVMVHLAVHLPREALLGGPLHYRWMYYTERLLGTYKGYVSNRARPEGSIAERYIAKECINFCSMYLNGIESVYNKDERNNDGGDRGSGLPAFTHIIRPFGEITRGLQISRADRDIAHWFTLFNSLEVEDYLKEHKKLLADANPRDIEKRQRQLFPSWFKRKINQLRFENSAEASDDLWSLANGPLPVVCIYSGCIYNGVRFHTHDRDSRRKSQNSGVYVVGDHKGSDHDFYGHLSRVWELTYLLDRKVYLFECQWYNSGSIRTCKTETHVTTIDVSSRWYTSDPFVFPDQVEQVYYVNDTKLGGNWKIVERLRRRGLWNISEMECVDLDNGDLSSLSDVFQQDETIDIDSITVGDVNDSTLFARHDVEAEIIPNEVVMQSRKRALVTDDSFIHDNDDEELEDQYSGDDDDDDICEDVDSEYDEYDLSFSK